ncbi:K(+)-transporting ATPase subunit F [Mesorhizobium sp.]|uniref:K(+)-transporting ATPase subunit F n=1 Tax=Mesorhizobium sp. TaxID=1871066 RepID=UPI00345B4A3C
MTSPLPAAGKPVQNEHKGQIRWTSSFSGQGFCFSPCSSPSSKPATVFRRRDRNMLVDYVLGGAVTLFLLAYLTYALIRPERF